MTTKRTVVLFLLICLAGLMQVNSVLGQEARGTILGVVKDASGGVVPGAEVKVTHKAMGTVVTVVTNDTGLYQVSYLIPGKFKIEVVMPGFKSFVADDVELRVSERLEINVPLEVGEQSETVLVTGETPLLNTASASLGQVIDSRRVADLPIPHNNPYFLIGLASGATFTRDARLDRPFEPTHIVGYGMDGSRQNRGDVTVDGAVSTATANAGEVIASWVPPADTVDEIAVQTATFDASFGQTEGGVTNISMKSGTNDLHGTAYWAKMAPGLFANDFYANSKGEERGEFDYNRWGGTAGGPVWIPGLYNGRNKTFFFWGYEGIHESRPRNTSTFNVPTQAMKNGDFSALLALGSKYQIYNPFTRRPAAGGRYAQDPFENNIIPANLINPVAKKILEYFPDPLQPGDADFRNNFLQPNLPETIKYYTHTVRIDHVLSDKHKMFGRGSVYRRDSFYNDFFHNLTTGNSFQFLSRAFTFDDVYSFNPTTVMNLRYGYNRFIRGDAGNPESMDFDLTTLGFPSQYNDLIPSDIRRFPRIDLAGYQGTSPTGYFRPNDSHSFVGNLNKVHGSHAFRTGVEFRAYRETNRTFAAEETGRFNFDGGWVRGPLDNSTGAPNNVGQSVAALLLGLPSHSNTFVTRAASYAEQSTSWGVYFQDDWKMSDRLTVNLGLRYEYEGPLTERFDRTVRGFDFDLVQPIEVQARAIYAKSPIEELPVDQLRVRGGLTFAGVNGEPHGLWNSPKKQFMPRVGLALKLDQKTVVRAGYGIFFGFLGQRRTDVIQTGFSRNTPFIATTNNGLDFTTTLSNPYPDGLLDPVGSSLGSLTNLGAGVTFFNENPKTPYMQRWQIGFQRDIGAGYVVDVGYVGNRGTHLEFQDGGNASTTRNINVTPNQYLSTSPTRDDVTNNYLTAQVANPFYDPATKKTILPAGASGSLTSEKISRERLLRPFPGFDSVNVDEEEGWSWYHSFQTTVQKRFSRGYTLMGNYTYSEFMQATAYLNAADLRPTEVISDLDRPHRLTLSGIYEFPFGPGKPFGGDLNPVLARIVGGWQLSGIYTYQSGPLLEFGNVIFKGSNPEEIILPKSERTVDRWFNNGWDHPTGDPRNAGVTNRLWETDSKKQLTNNIRTFPFRFTSIRGDLTNNYDFAFSKKTEIAEGKKLEFKADFLNAFNHVQHRTPNMGPSSGSFAKVDASTQANYARRIQISLKFIF